MDRENYQEIIQSLQTGQTRVNNLQQIRVYLQEDSDNKSEEEEEDNESEEEEEEHNDWVLNILEDLITAMMDDGSQLKSLDIAGSGI